MQKIVGYMRKAIQEFGMLENGDKIGIGVSGGKDSVALLMGMRILQRFIGIDYEIVGITLDPGFEGVNTDYTPIAELCKQEGIPYYVKRTQIGEIVFDVLNEKNPCSLCARMRRGALHDTATELGCNKIALGHHYDDAVETFLMNLFQGGNIACFSPVSYLSRKRLTMIRPLVFAPEKEIASAIRRAGLPVVKSRCPVDGGTERERTKQYLRELEQRYPGVTYKLFGAMRRGNVDGWGYTGKGDRQYSKDNI